MFCVILGAGAVAAAAMYACKNVCFALAYECIIIFECFTSFSRSSSTNGINNSNGNSNMSNRHTDS